MVHLEDESAWRVEFEETGETLLRDALNRGGVYNHEAKREAALRWLSEQEQARKSREEKMYRLVRWTLLVAVATMIASILSLVVTLAGIWIIPGAD
jgi:hypothetical protein